VASFGVRKIVAKKVEHSPTHHLTWHLKWYAVLSSMGGDVCGVCCHLPLHPKAYVCHQWEVLCMAFLRPSIGLLFACVACWQEGLCAIAPPLHPAMCSIAPSPSLISGKCAMCHSGCCALTGGAVLCHHLPFCAASSWTLHVDGVSCAELCHHLPSHLEEQGVCGITTLWCFDGRC